MPLTCSDLAAPFRMMLTSVTWLLLYGAALYQQVGGQCPVPGALQGTWYRASDGVKVTLTSTGVRGHWVAVGSTNFDTFQCARHDGEDTFVFGLEQEVDGAAGKVLGYFCWQLTRQTDTTYLLYQLTSLATSGSFHNERAVSTGSDEAVPPIPAICQLSPGTQHPTLLYRLSDDAASDVDVTSIATAVQQCPPEVFATYSYVTDDDGCAGTDSRLDFCLDRKSAHIDYKACNVSVLFSETGVLSCAASFTQNSDTYVLLVNHDSSVDDESYFRFACMRVERNGQVERAVVYPRDCTAPEGAHTLSLTRIASCPLVYEEEDGDDVVPIVAGVIVSVVIIIIIIAVVILLCTKGALRKRRAKVKPTSPSPHSTAQNGVERHDRRNADIAITIAPPSPSPSPSTSAMGDYPAPEGETVVGGRLPPLPLDAEKTAPLRA